jgi:hypothetical protein
MSPLEAVARAMQGRATLGDMEARVLARAAIEALIAMELSPEMVEAWAAAVPPDDPKDVSDEAWATCDFRSILRAILP